MFFRCQSYIWSTTVLHNTIQTTTIACTYVLLYIVQVTVVTETEGSLNWAGFKIVGDNLDKNIQRRHQTYERQTQSVHAFHYYGVVDRCDLSMLSDIAPTPPTTIACSNFRPSLDSLTAIEGNFCTYIARLVHNSSIHNILDRYYIFYNIHQLEFCLLMFQYLRINPVKSLGTLHIVVKHKWD